jgi:hypothetical protein
MSAQTARLGVVILCHTALRRAAQLARFWLQADCPVVLHVDRSVSEADLQALKSDLGAHPLLRFSPRHRCDWGSWRLVLASQEASALLLKDFPSVGHVLLSSGSCLPLRPAAALLAHLDAHPETDFIESVSITHADWITGGLSEERFTLYFPFNWRRQRWLFDRCVDLQRKLKLRRRIPAPLRPHMGSQWWCLTRATLDAILTDPNRTRYERYFRQNWIPDESYFQTLARLHAREIESRSLTLVKFDRHGRPNLFYDDHLQLLRRSDCFLARKIWPEAERLYSFFLSDQAKGLDPVTPEPAKIDRYFELAEKQRVEGRAGLYMQSRFPHADSATTKSAAPYSVFTGFEHVFQNFDYWLGQVTGARVHGHLFAPDAVHFHGGARVWHGAISNSAAIRDYNPRMFLTNLLWATRPERQCFLHGPGDVMDGTLSWFMATDTNAQISVIRGAWLLGLQDAPGSDAEKIARAGLLHRQEQDWVENLNSRHTLARVRIWSLAEFMQDPSARLSEIVREIAGEAALAAHGVPPLRAADGFEPVLARLRNQGLPAQVLKECQF